VPAEPSPGIAGSGPQQIAPMRRERATAARRAGLDRTLAALADPYRRRVIDLLSERPHRADELSEAVGVAPPALSRHLKLLRESGLVQEAHPAFDARVRIYSLRQAPMVELRAWLDEAERLWSDQLAGFKAHLERVRQ
jgi:DNA-binding transcriptional ArsR family regulator